MQHAIIKRILDASVYDVAVETPLEKAPSLSARLDSSILFKREDLQTIFSFKIRGAYNKIRLLAQKGVPGVVTASAGNHAQGVALSARQLGLQACIVMGRATPQIKVNAASRLGAEIVLHGDTYDEAAIYAADLALERNLAYVHPNLRSENIYEVEYDCCGPPWVTGKRNFAMCGTSEVAVSVLKDCDWEIRVFNYAQKQERVLHPKLGVLDDIVCSEIGLFYLAGDWKNYPGIYLCSEEESNFSAPRTLTRPKIPATFTESLISSPQHLTFKSNNNEEAHGIYYAPKNSQFCLPKDELPPLLVNVHGGPTGTAQKAFNPMHQFWTSRGFAVFDLNHRGSSGYGRNFRKKLYGGWGVVDVEDAISATKFLVEQELANATQIAIRGGSAGGYLVLACLAASDCFSAGASYYGIADLELLTKDTHKFESQYLERLIGPYPEAQELYKDRSPIHKLENIAAPVLILQGKLDKIVPPNQADLLYKKLVKGNTRTELILFENEGHGFRAPANQIRALDSELAFYRKNLLAKDGK